VVLCSDHGFHSGALRRQDRPRIPAAPAEDHRPVGILALNGPGFREDVLLHGATQMDIAPTVLRLLGVPAAQDFDGSPLEDALAETLPPARQPIRSWDMVPGNAGQHDDASSRLDANASQALLDQLAAIGYIDGGQATDPAYIASCRAETEWNLARVYLYSGRPFKAAPILARLHHRSPLRLDVALGYYECLQKLGLSETAGAVVRTLAAAHEGAPTGDFLAGVGLSMAGRHEEALQRFRKAETELCEDANLLFYLGQALVRIRALDEAESVFRRLLDINPDFQHAAYALARLLLRTGRAEEALGEVRRCLSLDFGNARNHFLHGRILARMGRYDEAIAAVGEAVRLEPANVRAHLYRRGLLLRTARNDEVGPIEAIQSEMLARGTEALRRRQELAAQLDAIQTQAVAEAEEKGRGTQDILLRLDALLPAADRLWEHLGTPSGKTFVVVSGLPRSGTSLMMQMLETAGLAVKTDGERRPDPDNPRGYLEWERVKSLPRNPLLLDDVVEDAVKIVTPHLPHLPPHHRYLIVYMTRPLEEVARSQTRMMQRLGTPVPFAQNEPMIEELKQLEESVLRRVHRHPGVRLLQGSFPALNKDPAPVLRQIVDFLGEKRLPHADRMRAVIRPELYRQRGTKEDAR
jgi:tetratricopeptide (TPR) repeat protein